MPGMPTESEAQAEQRRTLLDQVAQMCERADIAVTRGRFDWPCGASVVALVCAADESNVLRSTASRRTDAAAG